MPLFGKDKDQQPARPRLVNPQERAVVGYREYDETLAQVLSRRAYALAEQSAADIKRGDGAREDLQAVADSLEGVYLIAQRLDKIDRTFVAASAELLDRLLADYSSFTPGLDSNVTDADTWREESERQAEALKQWVDAVDRPAKRQWFQGLYALRAQVLESLLASYGHLQSLRRDMAFLHTAISAQDLLPEFAVQDARAEVLAAEGAARKAELLADHAASLDQPLLAALDEPQSPQPLAGDEAALELS